MLFSELAESFSKIENEASRIAMSNIIAELFRKCKKEEIKPLIYILEGNIAPPYEGLEVGIGEKLAIKSLAQVSGYKEEEIKKLFKKEGDLGQAAEKLIAKKMQLSLFSSPNTLEKVYSIFLKMAKIAGEGSQEAKILYLCELLNSANPLEAKYLIRFCLGKLRLGVGDPTIIDALSMAKNNDKKDSEMILRSFNICSDLGKVGEDYLFGGNLTFSPKPFMPIRPALAERLPNAEEIIKKIGKCAVEAKYDGLRMQVHLKDKKVEIFSRSLEKMTEMFPEITEAALKLNAKEAIFEGEALAYDKKEKKYLSFQQTIQRKRKYGIEKMKEDFPLKLFVFDLMYLNGQDLTVNPYMKRRKMLEKLVKNNPILILAKQKIVESAEELNKYFEECINEGLEGIIAKDLNQPYIAGARKFAWIKLKKSYGQLVDTIDAVIVGYYLGKGQRKEFEFGGLLVAVLNEQTNELETIAKIGSGFSEEEMQTLQELLEKIKIEEKPPIVKSKLVPDFWVEPKYVITIAADEITLSPMHTCGLIGDKGYALRFPRMLSFRFDKEIKDITTTEEIIKIFEMQKNKQIKN